MPHEIEALFLDASGTLFGDDFSAPEGVFVFEDAESLLERLQERAIAGRRLKSGIVTNWGRKVHRVLNAHGLTSYFDVVVCLDDVANGKPAPDPFLLAAAAAGVEPENCLFVGDSVYDDAFGAFDAGLQALWLNRRHLTPQGEVARMLEVLGHPVCTSLTEVLKHLERLFEEKKR